MALPGRLVNLAKELERTGYTIVPMGIVPNEPVSAIPGAVGAAQAEAAEEVTAHKRRIKELENELEALKLKNLKPRDPLDHDGDGRKGGSRTRFNRTATRSKTPRTTTKRKKG